MRADRIEQPGRDVHRYMLRHFQEMAHTCTLEEIREWVDGEIDGGDSYEIVCAVIAAIKTGWASQ